MSIGRPGAVRWRTEQTGIAAYAVFGTVIYLVVGIVTFLYWLVRFAITGEGGGILYSAQVENTIAIAAVQAFRAVDGGGFGFAIALGLGAFYYFVASTDNGPVTAAAVAAAVGTAVTLVLFFVVLLIADSGLIHFGTDVIGLVLSVVLAGAVAAAVPWALDAVGDST